MARDQWSGRGVGVARRRCSSVCAPVGKTAWPPPHHLSESRVIVFCSHDAIHSAAYLSVCYIRTTNRSVKVLSPPVLRNSELLARNLGFDL